MKKVLFASTALLAAGAFASSAQANEAPKLTISGYMEQYVVAANQDGDLATETASTDVQSDTEIHFKWSTTLDNGMKVAAKVEMEGEAAGIDEQVITISGKYGSMNIGAEDGAQDLMSIDNPSVSRLGGTIADAAAVLPLGTGVTAVGVDADFSSDAMKVTYFTPKMYGLQAGVSFTPDNDDSGTDGSIARANFVTATNQSYDDIWEAGLTYSGEFSGVGVAASMTYEIADTDTTSAQGSTDNTEGANEIKAAGLELSYMGFTVGGNYVDVILEGQNDAEAWSIGGAYAEGPYSVSLVYVSSEVEQTATVDRSIQNQDDEVDMVQLAGRYKLGAGVELFGEIDYINSEDAKFTNETAEANAAQGNEGAVGGLVGLRLSF